jgi:hypothetical protein
VTLVIIYNFIKDATVAGVLMGWAGKSIILT